MGVRPFNVFWVVCFNATVISEEVSIITLYHFCQPVCVFLQCLAPFSLKKWTNETFYYINQVSNVFEYSEIHFYKIWLKSLFIWRTSRNDSFNHIRYIFTFHNYTLLCFPFLLAPCNSSAVYLSCWLLPVWLAVLVVMVVTMEEEVTMVNTI